MGYVILSAPLMKIPQSHFTHMRVWIKFTRYEDLFHKEKIVEGLKHTRNRSWNKNWGPKGLTHSIFPLCPLWMVNFVRTILYSLWFSPGAHFVPHISTKCAFCGKPKQQRNWQSGGPLKRGIMASPWHFLLISMTTNFQNFSIHSIQSTVDLKTPLCVIHLVDKCSQPFPIFVSPPVTLSASP